MKTRVCCPGEQYKHQLVYYYIVNFLLKTNNGRDRRPNYVVSVIGSASYVSAKTLELVESVSSSSCYGQL